MVHTREHLKSIVCVGIVGPSLKFVLIVYSLGNIVYNGPQQCLWALYM